MRIFDPDNIIEDYIQSVSTGEDEILRELHRCTYLKAPYPQMISGHIQGKVLEMISRMISPGLILETGTFTGYSAICLARGLKPGGKLITIEINEELKEMSTDFFKKADLDKKIELINGDAREIIPSLNYQFDLAYIDAVKEQYVEFYELIIDKIHPGGFILADNTLWDGKLFNEPGERDGATSALHAFNLHVHKDPRVENVIIPIRDGLSILRKKVSSEW